MTGKDRIQIVKGDIAKIAVDAIVNAANTSLLGGGGVDGAIHRAGGPQILEECRAIVARQGGCAPGEAVITGGGALPAKWVIHTVGPVWNGGHKGEREKLAACYRNSLRLAEQHGIRSIAFPNISTGVYRFPKADAATIAYSTVLLFLDATDAIDEVQFVCFDDENYTLLLQQHDNAPS
ncbi:O-acetyl-ADP-ribose deacetylase [Flaviaesturariibacter amylovorans]|uniref:ADP-ribose-binding protein n=1 Tax=Flaviaesturariibacter amylovorans TaxID=1084520 RepID=A0ABP8GMN0_9BACT